MLRRPPRSTLLPSTTLFRSNLLPTLTAAENIALPSRIAGRKPDPLWEGKAMRSEEHTSELQSRQYLVCRLLLEKKNKRKHERGLVAVRVHAERLIQRLDRRP